MNELYMVRDEVRYGPFPEPTVRQFIAERKLVPTDMVWFAGMEAWAPASVALAGWFPAAPPVPPPLPAVSHSPQEAVFVAPRSATAASVFDRMHAPAPTQSPFVSDPYAQPATHYQAAQPQLAAAPQVAAAPIVQAPVPADARPIPREPRAPVVPDAQAAELSKTWRARFEKIELALGVGLDKFSALSFAEKLSTCMGLRGTGINFLAGIFGPLYYLIKGMWRPAISLTALFVVISQLAAMAVEPLGNPGLAYAVNFSIGLFVFGGSANLYYYRKVRMGDKSWW